MKKYKLILILFISGVLISCHRKDSKTNKDLLLDTTNKEEVRAKRKGFHLKSKGNNLKEENGIYYFSISTVLNNNTAETIHYGSFYCSWEFNYEISNNSFQIHETECDKNFPVVISVLPYSMDRERILEIRTKKRMKRQEIIEFKVGFNYIPVKDGKDVNNKINPFAKHHNLIWREAVIIH